MDTEKNCQPKEIWGRLVEKLKEKSLPRLTKKSGIALIAIIVAAIAIVIGLNVWNNNYKTPLRDIQHSFNSLDRLTPEKKITLFSNGLGKSELKKIFRLLENSDYYLDWRDEEINDMVESADLIRLSYGDDYKVKYEVEGKTELTSAELREYRSDLKDDVELLGRILDYTEEFDSGDWGYFADEMDLTKADAKKLIALLSDLQDDLGRLEVTKGYELELRRIISGSQLEEQAEGEDTMIVLKVNGRWITEAGLGDLADFLYLIAYAMY